MAEPVANNTPPHAIQQVEGLSPLFRSSAGAGTILALQRALGNEAVGQLLRQEPDDSGFSGIEELDQRQNGLERAKLVQAQSSNGHANSRTEEQEDHAGSSETRQARCDGHSRALLVPDDAHQIEPGQMRKTEFLNKLKASVSRAAEDELKGTIWSAMDCAYIERWFGHYGSRDGKYIEGALRKYAPEAAEVISAADYIPILTARVRKGIAQWTRTDE